MARGCRPFLLLIRYWCAYSLPPSDISQKGHVNTICKFIPLWDKYQKILAVPCCFDVPHGQKGHELVPIAES